MINRSFDVIIIGAGSVGTPIAYYLAKEGFSVLAIDKNASIGQGSNKAAIGGIRATHSNPAKVHLCLESLDEFSTWQDIHGDDIEWIQGGYSFVAYDEDTKNDLLAVVDQQKPLNTGLVWLSSHELSEVIPALNRHNLLGGTYSPRDGSASPLKSIYAFGSAAQNNKARFVFNEEVVQITHHGNFEVTTTREKYNSQYLVNAAGAYAADIGCFFNEPLPVRPNMHEAGVTEPVQRFLNPMIVDMRAVGTSTNIYFYQHATGQILFCLTPTPPIWGTQQVETSQFLPLSAQRILSLVPSLEFVKVRRTWSGLYPMTPDGSPLLGWSQKVENLFIAAGMCGQGFMLGPGIGKFITRIITHNVTETDMDLAKELSPYRQFAGGESLE
jgi:sarcosine oxidase, subunit beta